MWIVLTLQLKECGVLAFFFQAEDGIRDGHVTGVQTCALPISLLHPPAHRGEDQDPPHPGVRWCGGEQRTNLDGYPLKRYNIRRCLAGWCNGSTSDSESLSPGSNPGPAASQTPCKTP